MIGPISVFAFVIATLISATFHLLVGGNAKKLALYLLTGWFGFVLGQFAGQKLSVEPFPIGYLQITSASSGAIILLITARLLSRSENNT